MTTKTSARDNQVAAIKSKATGKAKADRDQLARWADEMMADIAAMQKGGTLPATLPDFSTMHDYIDANVGWSDEIDSLPHRQWVELSNIVDARLRDAAIPRGGRERKQDAFGNEILAVVTDKMRLMLARQYERENYGTDFAIADTHNGYQWSTGHSFNRKTARALRDALTALLGE